MTLRAIPCFCREVNMLTRRSLLFVTAFSALLIASAHAQCQGQECEFNDSRNCFVCVAAPDIGCQVVSLRQMHGNPMQAWMLPAPADIRLNSSGWETRVGSGSPRVATGGPRPHRSGYFGSATKSCDFRRSYCDSI